MRGCGDVGREMLLEYGYRVITASNGREALQIYGTKRESISLVILDLSMPEMGGVECLRALLSMDPNVRVLVATGYAQEGDREELKQGLQTLSRSRSIYPNSLRKYGTLLINSNYRHVSNTV